MDTTQDRRVLRTKKAIMNAFISLLEEKDYNEISVTDIAKRADVNRKTFYNYYGGVYAVAEALEDQLLAELSTIFFDPEVRLGSLNPYRIFEELTRILDGGMVPYGKLLTAEKNLHFVQKIRDILITKAKESLAPQVNWPAYILDATVEYTVSGMLAVYQNWYITGKQQSVSELAKSVAVLCVYGLDGMGKESAQ